MRTLRKTLALVLAIAMVLTTFGAVTVSANTYADTNGHWAEGVIDTWSGYGVIQGDGGYFRPDDAITRAEVAQITQNVIGYVTSAPNSFIDVADNAWYTDAVLKLVAADVLTGNGDGTMTPDANMTREEAMTMLSRAYGLAPVNNMAGITNYADYSSISEYAQGYIGAMTAAGYVGGYPDGTIRPKDNIARGEFVKILDNMIKLYITGPGTYGPGYFGGIVMVKSGGVTLNGVIADKAVVSPLVSGDVITNNAQLTNGVLNLSDSATVNSEQGNGTSLSGVIAGGYYGGSYGGGSGGSSSGSRNYTIRFYVDGELYATKTAAYNSYLSASLPVDPTAANQVFVGWYESQADANAADTLEPIDPGKIRVTGTADYYAGFTATSAVPTQAPTVSLKDPSEEYDPSAPTEVKAELVTKDGKEVTVNSVVWEGTDTAAQSVKLTKDKDYTVEGNTVKFSEEFLSGLYDGTHNVQIMTDAGAVSFDIVVKGSSVSVPTAAPATQAPATQAPATQAPATQAPATQAPATQAPATQAPATQAPATQAPAKLYNATLKVNGGEGELTAAAAPTQAPAQPTQAPAEPTKAPDNPPAVGGESKVWNFTEGEWKDFSFLLDENAASQKTVDGITVGAVKGVSGAKSITTSAEDGLKLSASGSCYFSYTAAEAGTIKFTVKASGDSPYKKDGDTTLRSIKITKGTEKEKEDTYCSADPLVLTKDYSYDLAAGETIQVAGGTNGFYLPALSFTPTGGSVEPSTPTQAPAEPTQAPSTGGETPEGASTYTVDKNALISEGKKLTDDANVTVVNKYSGEVGEDKDPETLTISGREFDSTSFLRVRSANTKPKSVSDLTFFASTGAMNPDNTPSSFDCTILEITPHVDGVFKIYYRRQPESGTENFIPDSGKDTKLADETTAAVPCASENIETMTEGKDYGYGTKTWNLSKDKLYGLWAAGTTGVIYSYEFIPAASASDAVAEAAELTPVEDTDGLYKYIRDQYVADNLEVSFNAPKDEISYKSTFGNKYITVYSKGEGTAPKLGIAKNYDGGRIILRTGTMAKWDVDLNNVIAVCAPYDCKIKVRAGQSSGKEGEDTTLTINAQTGLGLDNPTKKALSYTLDVRNGDVDVPETYSAKEGDIVYFWFDSGAGTVVSFTFLKDEGGSEPAQPTQAPAEPTQAPATAEPTQAPATAEPTQAPAPAEPGIKTYQFEEGATVTYSGTPAVSGAVPEIKVTGADGKDIPVSGNSFTMPAQDVRVEVTYTAAAETYTVSVADGITGGSVVLIPEATEKPAEPTKAPEATEKPAEPTKAPEATEKPAEPTNAPEGPTKDPAAGNDYPEGSIVWDFGKEPFINADGTVNTTMFPAGTLEDRYNVGPDSIVNVNGLTYYTTSDMGTKPTVNAFVKKGTKNFADGRTFTSSIKTQGRGTLQPAEEPGEYIKDKCFEFTTPESGTVYVYAASGDSNATVLHIAINNSEISNLTLAGSGEKPAEGYPVLAQKVFGGEAVQVYSDTNTSYYAIVFSPDAANATAAEVPAEGVKSISGLKGGETIKVYAEAENAGDEIKLATDPSAEIKDIGGGYYEFTMPKANTTVSATFGGGAAEPTTEPGPSDEPGGVPEKTIWRVGDPAVLAALKEAGHIDTTNNTTGETEANGALIGPNFTYNAGKNASFDYTDGQKYTFNGALGGGSGSATSRYIKIVPKQGYDLTVTVVYDTNNSSDEREQYIDFGGERVGGGKGKGVVAAVADLSKDQLAAHPGEPIITYGGGNNKNIYAIILDYFVSAPDKTVSGALTNATGYDLSGSKLVFTNVEDPSETYTTDCGDKYSIVLPKGKTFSVSVEGHDDVCTTIDTKEITVTQNKDDMTVDIKLVKIEELDVTGTVSMITSHDVYTPVYAYPEGVATTLVFTNAEDPTAVKEAAVNADGTYTVKLMSAEDYNVTIKDANGYTLSPLSETYTLEGGVEDPYKNILLMKDVAEKLDYKDTLTVGADKDYPTIREALAAARLMEREPGQVVNIVIDPGTYTEQLYVNIDDIALKAADPANRPLIQWYYGIGYLYYSSAPGGSATGAAGWYNADYAVSKTVKSAVNNWGAAIRTLNRGFYMENINVENTFNKFINPAEIADGVACGDKDWERTANRTPKEMKQKEGATERAAAIFAGGSQIELYRCSFSSSQDTFGTGAASMYVKECDIAGNTDYICGGDNCYFENCNLIWQGYSDKAAGGYITASKTSKAPHEDLGYYFKNCTVKYNTADPDMKFTAGDWGRNWGGVNAQTIFDHTIIDTGVDKPGKWGNMGGDPTKISDLYVVNGVYSADNLEKDLTDSDDNPRGTYVDRGYELPAATDFFGDWTPANYIAQ